MSTAYPYVISKSLWRDGLFAKTQTLFRHCELPNQMFRLSVGISPHIIKESVL